MIGFAGADEQDIEIQLSTVSGEQTLNKGC